MQTDMPITTHRSKWKQEVKFQYGGLSFSKTGSSFISAVDLDISSKFSVQIDFHLLKQMPSLNQNPDNDFRLCGCHLEKSIWRHNSATNRSITTTFGRQMQNDMSVNIHRSKSKPEVKFCHGATKSVYMYTPAVDSNISLKYSLHRVPSSYLNPATTLLPAAILKIDMTTSLW